VTEEWLAAAVVKESAEAIVVTDPAGIIRLWNDGGRAHLWLFGCRDDGAKPGRDSSRRSCVSGTGRAYFQTMTTGYTRYGDKALERAPRPTANGHRLSIEFSVALPAGRLPAKIVGDIGDHA